MRTIKSLAFLAGLLPAVAAAQVSPFPQQLPANTVAGRLGVTPGPVEAIPFAVLSSKLSGAIITLNSGNGQTAPGAMSGGNTYSFGATSDKVQITGLGLGGSAPATGLQVYNAPVNPGAGGQGSVGASSVNGAGLIGQGSVYDSYLGNDANSIALGVSTGTQNVVLLGTLTAANLATSGTVAGGICATSGGAILFKSGANCYAVTGVSVASGKTLTVNNTLTLNGTDGTTFTYPGANDTLAGLGATQTFTGVDTFSGTLNITGTGQLNGTPFGTFATQNYATPPAIGGTTPNTGAFSTLTATTPIAVASGGTNANTAQSARASGGLNIDELTSKGDTNYTMLATDRTVGTSAALTAPRTWTLPAASSVNAGQNLLVQDFVGGVSGTNTLTISRAGTDTINGGATTITLNSANGGYLFISNGVSNWSAQALGAQATSGVASINGQTGSPSIVAGTNISVATTGGNIQVSEVVPSTADKRIWVSTGGNDSNSGLSPQAAKLTISAAVNAANPGGIVYVGAGTYTLTSTLAMQPGVTLSCPQGATITQGASQNLTNIIDFAANSANGAAIYGCTIDGNRANNTLNLANSVVNIGSANNVTITNGAVIQNGTGMGTNITTGIQFSIKNNIIKNNVYAGIYGAPRALSITYGEVAGNQFQQVDGHAIIFDGVSYVKTHDNFMVGTLVTGLTANVSGTTVTVTAGGTPFSNTCSATTLCPGDFIKVAGSGEIFITGITSSTVATSSASHPTVTGASAYGGTGDMIDNLATAANNDFYNNIVVGATAGFVDGDEGDAGNFGTHSFTSYRGNYFQTIAESCLSIQQVNASYFISYVSFLGNSMQNCMFGGQAVSVASVTSAIAIGAAGTSNVSRVYLDGNSIYDTQGTPTTQYWLSAAGSGSGSIVVGKNTNQGMINAGISGAISSIALNAGWGSTATTSSITSNGDSFQFAITASGTGQAAGAQATINQRVTSSENPPQPQCKVVNASAIGDIGLLYGENSSTVGSTIANTVFAPVASAVYQINCHL